MRYGRVCCAKTLLSLKEIGLVAQRFPRVHICMYPIYYVCYSNHCGMMPWWFWMWLPLKGLALWEWSATITFNIVQTGIRMRVWERVRSINRASIENRIFASAFANASIGWKSLFALSYHEGGRPMHWMISPRQSKACTAIKLTRLWIYKINCYKP